MPPTEALYLRVAPELKDALQREARRAGLSLTEWSVASLRRALGEREPTEPEAETPSPPPRPDHGASTPRAAFPVASPRPVGSEPGSRSPSAIAASLPGVVTASSLAGPAKPLSKTEQSGRRKPA